jgi:hypothetical protein
MTQDTSTSRRTLVMGAAWTAPAIVLASAAPAMALSTPVSGPIVSTSVEPTTDNGATMPVSVTFSNPYNTAIGAISVTVQLSFNPASGRGVNPSASPSIVTAGWVHTGSAGSNQNRSISFTNASGIPAATSPESPATLNLSFFQGLAAGSTAFGGTITTMATASGATITAGSGVFT